MKQFSCWAANLILILMVSSAIGSDKLSNGQTFKPVNVSAQTAPAPDAGVPGPIADGIALKNIPPLYKEPKMPGEGIWVREDPPGGSDTTPLIYRTFYRPAEKFPNAIVYMMVLNMKHLSGRLYLGSAEPYRKGSVSKVEDEKLSKLAAVTNALWQTRHAGKGGIILDGQTLKALDPGTAAIIFYKNDSVDIVEWNDAISVSEIRDARQLKHLIVNEGKVVTSIKKRGQDLSPEIGLGSLLNENQPVITVQPTSPEEKPTQQMNFTSGDLWFLATRSAFGIRPDGNLVFAVGRHISTVDLAKALVLAGCVRALHGDANPGNCVGVLYFTDASGKIVKKTGMSPLQDASALDRYTKGSYPKDFVAFFRRSEDAK